MSQEVTYKSLKMLGSYKTITLKSDHGRLPEVVLYKKGSNYINKALTEQLLVYF